MRNTILLAIVATMFIAIGCEYETSQPNNHSPKQAAIIDATGGDSGVVLVDFGATWCGPCLRLNPILNDLKKEYKGRAKIVKIDVDKQPDLAQAFGVGPIPAVYIVKDNQILGEPLIGLSPKSAYKNRLDDALAN